MLTATRTSLKTPTENRTVSDPAALVDPAPLPRVAGESDEQYAKRCAWATDPRNANAATLARTHARTRDAQDVPLPPFPGISTPQERMEYARRMAERVWQRAHSPGVADADLRAMAAEARLLLGHLEAPADSNEDRVVIMRSLLSTEDVVLTPGEYAGPLPLPPGTDGATGGETGGV